jgi:predicted glycosyltransferase
MNVWIDLSNSPHVVLFRPLVERLREQGARVLLTARDHAQTVELAQRIWSDVTVVGGESPPGATQKAATLARRGFELAKFARRERPNVALSHGSYAQIVAARAVGIPAVTMMDYEFQPANHLSFRVANRVIVPQVFPSKLLTRFGARGEKVLRYEGFKEELYLGRFEPDPSAIEGLGLDRKAVIAVFRPPPEGALYHRHANERFDLLLEHALSHGDVQLVVLPRGGAQTERMLRKLGIVVPRAAVDGLSLLAEADVVLGAGGTMNREAALLGTPTYSVFAGRLAQVDAELMRDGRLKDLRKSGFPVYEKKQARDPTAARARSQEILSTIERALAAVAKAPRQVAGAAVRGEA